MDWTELSAGILDILDELSTLDGVGDAAGFWSRVGGKMVGGMCMIGIYVTFITTCGALLQKFTTSLSFNLRDYWVIFAKAGLVVIFFCLLYPAICEMITSLASVLNESMVEGSMKDFRAQFRKFLYTMQTPPASDGAGIATRAWRGIANLFNKLTFLGARTELLNMFLVVACQIVLLFVFLFLSVGPFFLIFALSLGPVVMGLWILFPDIARGWANMVIASLFFSLATVIGFGAIASSGLFEFVSGSMLYMQHFQAVAFLILVLVYLTLVPFIMAQLFNCSAFNFLGRALGWLYSVTWVLAPLVILSEIMNAVVGGSFVKGKMKLGKK